MASIFDKAVALASVVWGPFNTWQTPQPQPPPSGPALLIPYGGANSAQPDPSQEGFYINPAPDPRILGTMTQTFCSLRPVYSNGLVAATYDLILAQSIHPLEAVFSLAIYDPSTPPTTLPVTYKVLQVPSANLTDTRRNYRVFRFEFRNVEGALQNPLGGFTARVDRANVILSPNFFESIAE